MRQLLALCTVVGLLGGCQIIINESDDDGDDDCWSNQPEYPDTLRNPDDGTCQSFSGGGGGGGCDDGPGGEAANPGAFPDWAMCDGFCETLDEATCAATDGCRGAYAINFGIDGQPIFLQCWGTAPSGPVRGTGCSGYDAHECSRHDDCRAIYQEYSGPGPDGTWTQGLRYVSCEPEAVCGGMGEPWPTGQLRDPYTGLCVGGGGCGTMGDAIPVQDDWAKCEACSGLDEDTCMATDGCRAAYGDTGLDSQIPGYLDCFGVAPFSGPIRGGGCSGLDAYECSRHDDCTALYWVGIDNQMPFFEACLDEQPTTPAPSCAEVGDEATCIDLTDGCLASGQCNEVCTPLYAGSDCTCSAGGCSCATWTYASCQSAGAPPPGDVNCSNMICPDGSMCVEMMNPDGTVSYGCR